MIRFRCQHHSPYFNLKKEKAGRANSRDGHVLRPANGRASLSTRSNHTQVLPVVLGLQEVELLFDAINGFADRQLERRSLSTLGKNKNMKTWHYANFYGNLK